MSSPVEKPPDVVRIAKPDQAVSIKKESLERASVMKEPVDQGVPIKEEPLDHGVGRASLGTSVPKPLASGAANKGIPDATPSSTLYPAVKVARPGPPSNPKYAKIQPAIAPKPMGALPKPKPFSPTAMLKNGKSAAPQVSDMNLNINTSKRWVLPPRPRPGRKPSSVSEEESKKLSAKLAISGSATAAAEVCSNSPKKRVKMCKKEGEDALAVQPEASSVVANGPSENPRTPQSQPISRTSSSNSNSSQTAPPPPPVAKSDPKTEINNLKLSYLNKLKEQELIRNYIEVITNQIKELSFVQNGVITFDALTTNRIKKASGTVLTASSSLAKNSNHDQLESINNLNDLNKFLGYLTKSSNIIHSVTRQSQKSEDTETVLNSQIHHYLNVRSKFKSMQKEETKKINNLKEQAQNKKKPLSLGIDKKALESKPSSILSNSSLTKGVLLPEFLGMQGSNPFDGAENDLLIDLVADDFDGDNNDLLVDEFLESENVVLDRSGLEIEEQQLGKVKIHDRNEVPPKALKKKSKFNCGFCTNDTPCLCLDAEIDMGLLK